MTHSVQKDAPSRAKTSANEPISHRPKDEASESPWPRGLDTFAKSLATFFPSNVIQPLISSVAVNSIVEGKMGELSALETYLKDLGSRLGSTFGDFREKTAEAIFSALNNTAFIDRIHTVDDFKRYAELLYTLACAHGSDGRFSQYTAYYTISDTVRELLSLARGDFERDFSRLVDTFKESNKFASRPSLATALSELSPLVRSTADLDKLLGFVKQVSKGKLSAVSILHDDAPFGTPSTTQGAARLEAWKKLSPEQFDAALSLCGVAYEHCGGGSALINGAARVFIERNDKVELSALETYLKDLGSRLGSTFGDFREKTAEAIFSALNNTAFIDRIHTVDDFKRYAELLYTLARENSERPRSRQLGLHDRVREILALTRDNFDNDLSLVSGDLSRMGVLQVATLARSSAELNLIAASAARLNATQTNLAKLLNINDTKFAKAWLEVASSSGGLTAILAAAERSPAPEPFELFFDFALAADTPSQAFEKARRWEIADKWFGYISRKNQTDALAYAAPRLGELKTFPLETAYALMGAGYSKEVVKALAKCSDTATLCSDLAKDPASRSALIDNWDIFVAVLPRSPAENLLEALTTDAPGAACVSRALSRWEKIPTATAKRLVACGHGAQVAANAASFGDPPKVADILLSTGPENVAVATTHARDFILRAVKGSTKLSETFRRALPPEFVRDEAELLAKHIARFSDPSKVVTALIEQGPEGRQALRSYGRALQTLLSAESALRLLALGDIDTLVAVMSRCAQPAAVLSALNEDTSAARTAILDAAFTELIQRHDLQDSLSPRIDSSIGVRLIRNDSSSLILNKAQLFDRQEALVAEVIARSEWERLASNLESLRELPATVAEKLILQGHSGRVAAQLPSFTGLTEKVALALLDGGHLLERATANTFQPLTLRVARRHQHSFGYLSFDADPALRRSRLPVVEHLACEAELKKVWDAETSEDRERCAELLYTKLASFARWNETGVAASITGGRTRFGLSAMLRFAGRADVSPHDALLRFDKGVRLIDSLNRPDASFPSKESPESQRLSDGAIFTNLFEQIRRDRSQYPAGKSYHHFNELVDRGIKAPRELKKLAAEFPPESSLRKYVESISSPQDIMGSWEAFKLYADTSTILTHKRAALLEVSRLDQRGKHALARYFESIAFHKGAPVNLESLINFVRAPRAFLNADDAHAPAEIHDRKKPSNYAEVRRLGLGVDQLRDALVEGALDEIQFIAPLAIQYKLAAPGKVVDEQIAQTPVKEMIVHALGRGPVGEGALLDSASRKRCFARLQSVVDRESQRLRKSRATLRDFLTDQTFNLTGAGEKEIRTTLVSALRDANCLDEDPRIFIAQVFPKSDSRSVLAGNDTACCMPFGSGKNNVYMFNPGCVQFTVQEGGDIDQRTCAQSVVTLDVSLKKTVPEIRQAVEQAGGRLEDIFESDPGSEPMRHLVCDSIESNPNFRAPENVAIIKSIYEDFFAALLEREGGRVAKAIPVSTSFGGPFQNQLTKRPNTFIPLAPMSYSDNLGAECLELMPKRVPQLVRARVDGFEAPARAWKGHESGISNITFRDCLPIARLEGKTYADNPEIREYLHTIQNTTLGVQIANSFFGAPTLMLKSVNSGGVLNGYLMAYEGLGETAAQPIVYVRDFAANTEETLSSVPQRLLKEFFTRYRHAYLEPEAEVRAPKIALEAREDTSYRLLLRKKEQFEGYLGCKFNIVETRTYTQGSYTMHALELVPLVPPELSQQWEARPLPTNGPPPRRFDRRAPHWHRDEDFADEIEDLDDEDTDRNDEPRWRSELARRRDANPEGINALADFWPTEEQG